MKILIHLISILTSLALIKCTKSGNTKSSSRKSDLQEPRANLGVRLSKPVVAIVALPSTSYKTSPMSSARTATTTSEMSNEQYEPEPERASVADGSVLSRRSRASVLNSRNSKHSSRREGTMDSDKENRNKKDSGHHQKPSKSKSLNNSRNNAHEHQGDRRSLMVTEGSENLSTKSGNQKSKNQERIHDASNLGSRKICSRSDPESNPRNSFRENPDSSIEPSSDGIPVPLSTSRDKSEESKLSGLSTSKRGSRHGNDDYASFSDDKPASRKSRSRPHTPSGDSTGTRPNSHHDDPGSHSDGKATSRKSRSRRSRTPSRHSGSHKHKTPDQADGSNREDEIIDNSLNRQVYQYVDDEVPTDVMQCEESSYCIPITPGLRMNVVGPEPLEYSENKAKLERLYGMYRDSLTSKVNRFKLTKYLDREFTCRALLTTGFFRRKKYYVWPDDMNDAVAIMLQYYGRGHGLVNGIVQARADKRLPDRREKFIVCPFVKPKVDHMYRFYASPSRHEQTYYIFSKPRTFLASMPNATSASKRVAPLYVNLEAHVRIDKKWLEEIKDITDGELSPV